MLKVFDNTQHFVACPRPDDAFCGNWITMQYCDVTLTINEVSASGEFFCPKMCGSCGGAQSKSTVKVIHTR